MRPDWMRPDLERDMATTGTSATPTSEIAIFARLIQSEKGDLAPDLARYLLTLGFPAADQQRMSELAERNQHGDLKGEEREEMLSYVRTSHLLALLHSKARKSLKRRRAS
jgi:hypothetical protein